MYFLQEHEGKNKNQHSFTSRYTAAAAAGERRVSAVALFAPFPQFQNGVTLHLSVYSFQPRIQTNFIRQLSLTVTPIFFSFEIQSVVSELAMRTDRNA